MNGRTRPRQRAGARCLVLTGTTDADLDAMTAAGDLDDVTRAAIVQLRDVLAERKANPSAPPGPGSVTPAPRPPSGARHVKRVPVLRAAPDAPRRTTRVEAIHRLQRDVVMFELPDGWHVEVLDGWGRCVNDLPVPERAFAAARKVANDAYRDLVEAAAEPDSVWTVVERKRP